MLFQIEYLGYTEIDGACISEHRNSGNWALLAVFVQFTHVGLVSVRIVQFANGKHGRLRSNRNTQSRNDQETSEGLHDLFGILSDILFHIFVLVRMPPASSTTQRSISHFEHYLFPLFSVW